MIQWVYEGCRDSFSELIVATDDERILNTVESFGGKSMLSSPTHRSGTERCAEVVNMLFEENGNHLYDYVVNIQGDEPLISENIFVHFFRCLISSDPDLATLVSKIKDPVEYNDPNTVKVVINKENYAMYFSRGDIPFQREKTRVTHFKHIGIYAYKPDILLEISKLKPTPLELSESLEQLRWLENGYKILTCLCDYEAAGVDTESDLKKIEALLSK